MSKSGVHRKLVSRGSTHRMILPGLSARRPGWNVHPLPMPISRIILQPTRSPTLAVCPMGDRIAVVEHRCSCTRQTDASTRAKCPRDTQFTVDQMPYRQVKTIPSAPASSLSALRPRCLAVPSRDSDTTSMQKTKSIQTSRRRTDGIPDASQLVTAQAVIATVIPIAPRDPKGIASLSHRAIYRSLY